MNSPDFSWLKDHGKILDLLSCDGGEARFVGGAVRNTYLHLPLDDFDIATTHKPDEVTATLETHGLQVIPTGIAQGTVTAILNGIPYQITTLRKDVITDGRWAEVDFNASWIEDAERRDFTMNAMYVDANGTVYDYFDGLNDLSQKLVRFIGDPYQRIREDFLRILRFFRINAHYGTSPLDQQGLQACIDLKDNLAIISKERITKEILRMLEAENPWACVDCLFEHGFIKSIYSYHKNIAKLESESGLKAGKLIRLASFGREYYKSLKLSRAEEKYVQNILHAKTPPEHIIYEYSKNVAIGASWMQACKDLDSGRLCDTVKFIDEYVIKDFPINGDDMAALGLQGLQLGEVLKKTKSWWIDAGCKASRDECISHASTNL